MVFWGAKKVFRSYERDVCSSVFEPSEVKTLYNRF